MDIHVIAPLASNAERAAVDAILDPEIGPATTWTGAPRDVAADLRVSRGGQESRGRRDLLLPALHAVQDSEGWIGEAALGYICRRLAIPPAEAYGTAAFYALLSTRARPPVVAHVCDDIVCRLAGAEDLCADLERVLGPAGSGMAVDSIGWERSPCLGQCERGPAALLTVAGAAPVAEAVGPVDAVGLVARLETAARRPGTRTGPRGDLEALAAAVPQAGSPGLRLLGRIGQADPRSVDAYRATGGYAGLARALEMGPRATIREVSDAGLVGRGGAAFPTGRKWEAVAGARTGPRQVVCNADESEPGTFKDRVLLEGDPFAIVEGMTIEAFAVGAERGWLYVRGEYPEALASVEGAIRSARAAGLLGPDILGSGFSFDVEVRRGAGAYVCGEETALFASIEGYRGEPQNKPPFPVDRGLFGQPTAINNVETLANVALILREGAAAYAAIGTEGSRGPKLFCLSGNVARPGVYEVDFGATLRELLDLAGGVPRATATSRPSEAAIRAILLGGAAGTFVGPDALDLPLTFEATRDAGAALGSGVVVVFDETADLAGALRRIAAFFRDESCGQCVPCRIGTVRQEEALARLAAGRPRGSVDEELALLRDLAAGMRDASICGLGQTASSAILSAIDRVAPFGPPTVAAPGRPAAEAGRDAGHATPDAGHATADAGQAASDAGGGRP